MVPLTIFSIPACGLFGIPWHISLATAPSQSPLLLTSLFLLPLHVLLLTMVALEHQHRRDVHILGPVIFWPSHIRKTVQLK